jgi:hypothetical protein
MIMYDKTYNKLIHRRFVETLIGSFLLLLVAHSASAVCLQPHPKANAEFFHSDAVFIGTVISQESISVDPDLDGSKYRMTVQKVFRGAQRDSIEVVSWNDSGRFPLDVGKQYLLFASQSKGRFEIGNCGNSALLSDAAGVILQIEGISKAGHTGEIEGRIISYSANADLSGIRAIARRGRKSISALTGKDGRFDMRVPAGKYSLTAISPNYSVVAFDLSYDSPGDFTVYDGGAVELQFVASRK